MMRLAFYIRESWEIDRLRHVPPISEAIRGKESESSPRTCSIGRPAGGTLCPRPITLQMASSAGRGPRPCLLAEPRRKSWRNKTEGSSISRDRGDHNRGGGGKNGRGGDHHHRRGVTAVVEAGEAHRVVVWLRAPPRGKVWSNNQGSGHSSGGRKGRRRDGAKGTFSVGRLVNLLPRGASPPEPTPGIGEEGARSPRVRRR